jgi:hypothetical protein
MNEQIHDDTDTLADEIVRYLAAVELFRACDCEPTWRPEVAHSVGGRTPAAADGEHVRSAR